MIRVLVENTPIDYLDFASPVSGLGSKMGLDATNKWPGETQRDGVAQSKKILPSRRALTPSGMDLAIFKLTVSGANAGCFALYDPIRRGRMDNLKL